MKKIRGRKYEETCGKYENIYGKYKKIGRKYGEVCRTYGEVQEAPSSPLYISCGIWKNSELSPLFRLSDLEDFRTATSIYSVIMLRKSKINEAKRDMKHVNSQFIDSP